jgi:rubredoxin
VANYVFKFAGAGILSVNDNEYKVWMCIICGWIYEEEKGAPEEGLKPGTRWDDVPEDFICPDCGASKEDFEMIEL